MLSALLSFFGGTAFRMLWGEVSAYLNKKQDHAFEIERMRLQEQFDAAQHARNLEALSSRPSSRSRSLRWPHAARWIRRWPTPGLWQARPPPR